MKRVTAFLCIFAILLLSGCTADEKEYTNSLVVLTDQYNDKVEVFDISTGELSENSSVWSYDLPVDGVADAKYRYIKKYGDVALMACGKDYACMVSYPDGELLWETYDAGDNPHSIELIPCGVIAVASSAGSSVRFFNLESDTPEFFDVSEYLQDAHGVLLDDERDVLWALGVRELTAYTVEIDEDNWVCTEEVTDLKNPLPSKGGHDLAADYSDPNSLLITNYNSAFRYNKTDGTFTELFTDIQDFERSALKGIGCFKNGDMITIRPDGKHRSWTSTSMNHIIKTSDGYENKTLTSEIGHYYKCRVWQKSYD